MTISRYLVMFAVCSGLLAGCGGGGSGAAPPPPPPPPPPPTNADPGGVWFGLATEVGAGDSFEILGISISSGELRFIDQKGVQYEGAMQVSGSTYTATFKASAPFGTVFSGGSTVVGGTLSGTFVQRDSLAGSYTLDTGERGTISLLYDPIHQRTSALAKLTGVWADAEGSPFNIDSLGRVFGQDAAGCAYNGTAATINPSFNVYRFGLTVSSCGIFDGAYVGLGVLGDLSASDDNRRFTFQLSSTEWALTGQLTKL
jgi:hypothetical protein